MLTTVPTRIAASTTIDVVNATRLRRANFAKPIRDRRGTGENRLVGQMPLDVHREADGRLVPARAILLERLHHDPVQVAPHKLTQAVGIGVPMSGHHGPTCPPEC